MIFKTSRHDVDSRYLGQPRSLGMIEAAGLFVVSTKQSERYSKCVLADMGNS